LALKSNNVEKFLRLRSEYPWFSYGGFDYTLDTGGLRVQYRFDLAGRYRFKPILFFPAGNFSFNSDLPAETIENLLFHIGMIEMISYWKAACPPKIVIKHYSLTDEQVRWWKKLYFNGLGEFFFLNSIDADKDSFTEILPGKEKTLLPFSLPAEEAVMIPVGGGKDSAVTLELLGGLPGSIPMILNPMEAGLGMIRIKGFENRFVEVRRTLDPLLPELNDKGFLNGHTPFSALLAFVALLAAALSGRRYIALSNESSANEATIGNTGINHQYSKTLEFERDFRDYAGKYMTRDIEYFSFLRPLNELQIAKLFSGFPQYFTIFKSCNAGSKTGTWCGRCAKCLFTWIILSPFVEKEKLLKIFGKDMLNDPELLPLLDELTGRSESKPFDCIGTIEEVNAALESSLPSPVLRPPSSVRIGHLLSAYHPHHIPPRFEPVLKDRLHG
jgi:hypothetical protein